MEDKVIHERYRQLACAVIEQLINDWLDKEDASDYSLYKAMQDCDWFDYLDLDREYLYVKVLDLKKKKRKKVKINRYERSTDI